jgi:hypothetical protein
MFFAQLAYPCGRHFRFDVSLDAPTTPKGDQPDTFDNSSHIEGRDMPSSRTNA